MTGRARVRRARRLPARARRRRGTLVGGLATRPPGPSQDGRTYVFTLRRGIRYSDGTPVRPGDFRASMERTWARPVRDLPPYFSRDRRRAAVHPRGGRGATSREASSRTRTRGRSRSTYSARPGVPAQADVAVGLRGALRHARAAGRCGPHATRHRPVSHRQLGRPPRRRARPQPALPPDRRRPGRVPGSDRDRGHPAGTRRDAHRGDRARRLGSTWIMDFPLRGRLPELVARAPGRLHTGPAGSTRGCSSTSGGRRSTTCASGGRSTSPSTAPSSSSCSAVRRRRTGPARW